MRACNGCRKRKIKCDAATTNTWPCSACTRLNVVCVPPTIGQDGELGPDGQGNEGAEAGASAVSEASNHTFPMPPTPPTYRDTNQTTVGTMPSYDMSMYSQFVPAQPNQPAMYNDLGSPPIVIPQTYQQPSIFPRPPPPSLGAGSDRGLYVEGEQSTAEHLSDVLGELKIDETGIGMVSSPRSKRGNIADTFSKLHISEGKEQIDSRPMRQSKKRSKRGYHLWAQVQARRFESLPNSCLQRKMSWNISESTLTRSIPMFLSFPALTSTTNGKTTAALYLPFSSKPFLHAPGDYLVSLQKVPNGLLWRTVSIGQPVEFIPTVNRFKQGTNPASWMFHV